ncbi:variable surface protein [Plasmodium gonderi]|uniref:Variable surface protein n=1 Tax=Plasmodium gonderi TaxID=77519 RepID=A0A1Y1JPK3_PLAGO|nr:variable surface protein [Plasmodium gonderi]GAW84180.1 variable surface protein [Plasmodium gonderi]
MISLKKSEKSYICRMSSSVNWDDVYNTYTKGTSFPESDTLVSHLGNLKNFLDQLNYNGIGGVTLNAQNCDSFNIWMDEKRSEYICNRNKVEYNIEEIFQSQFCNKANYSDCCVVKYRDNVCYGSSSMNSADLSSTKNYAVTYDAQIIKLVYSIGFPVLIVYTKIKKIIYNKYIKLNSIINNIQNSYSSNNIEEFYISLERKRINIHYPTKKYE